MKRGLMGITNSFGAPSQTIRDLSNSAGTVESLVRTGLRAQRTSRTSRTTL